jgi:hypothetical protein
MLDTTPFFLPFHIIHMAFHRKTNDGIIEKKTRIKWSVIWWMNTAVIKKKIPFS